MNAPIRVEDTGLAPPRPPPRPLAAAGLAVALGNGLAEGLDQLEPLVGGLLAWSSSRPPGSPPPEIASAWLTEGPVALVNLVSLVAIAVTAWCIRRILLWISTERAKAWIPLIVLAGTSAWRAAVVDRAPTLDRTARGEVEAEGRAAVDCDGRGTRLSALATKGDRQGSLQVLGPGWLARNGEWVRLLEAEPPVPDPRAPAPVPQGRNNLEVLPDQVVRLAPGPVGRSAPGPLTGCAPGGISTRLAALRALWLERLGGLESPAAAALAPAIFLGHTAGVDRATNDLFVRTGTRHLLAVSGTHLVLLALLLCAPVRCLERAMERRRARGLRHPKTPVREVFRLRWFGPATAFVLLLYVPLAGGGPSVRRAALVYALAQCAPLLPLRPGKPSALRGPGRSPGRSPGRGSGRHSGRSLGRSLGRRGDPLSLLGLAFLVEGLADPGSVRSLGVQLSYSATLGLLLLTRPLARAAARAAWTLGLPQGLGVRRSPGRIGHPPGWNRMVAARLAQWTNLTLCASAAAAVATLPFVWAHFGEWSPISIVATPLALPAVAGLLAASAGHAALPWLVAPAAVELPAELLVSWLELADRAPGTPCPLPSRPDLALALAGGLTALSAWRASGRHRPGTERPRDRAAWAASLAWAAVVIPWQAAPARLELVALDVGHGTAVVWRAPGAGCWVFDAGSRDRRGVATRALGPWLAHWEVVRPTVTLSHPDRDHASALPWLVERYPPRAWLGALPAPLRERLPHSTPHTDLPKGRLALANRGPLEISLIRGSEQPGNEGSRALEMVFRGRRVILLGDAEGAGLAAMLREAALPPAPRLTTELLLAPHHGSDSAHLGPLLDRTGPQRVWISATDPAPILGELRRRGIPVRATHRDGPLRLALPQVPLEAAPLGGAP